MAPDGTDPRPIDLDEICEFLRWSPDESRIACTDELRVLHVVNSDGTDYRPIKDGPYQWTPIWSPDGTEIVFFNMVEQFGRQLFDVHRIRPDGTGEAILPISGFTRGSPSWRAGG